MKPQKNASESGFTLIEVIITIVIVAIVAAMMTAYFGTGITQSSLPIFGVKDAGKLNEIMEKISAEYSKYPQWQKDKDYAAGTIIVPTPQNRTGLIYITTGGKSGSTEPTDWLKTSITDNTCTWAPNGPAPTLINQAWRTGPYSKNSIIVAGEFQYVTTTGGTSGATTPTWTSATTIGSTVTALPDGVKWQYVGPKPTLVLRDQITAKSATTYYGYEYSVIDNVFIKFGAEVNKPDGTREKTEVVLHDDDGADTTDVDYGKYLKVTIALTSNSTGEKLTTLFVLR